MTALTYCNTRCKQGDVLKANGTSSYVDVTGLYQSHRSPGQLASAHIWQGLASAHCETAGASAHVSWFVTLCYLGLVVANNCNIWGLELMT